MLNADDINVLGNIINTTWGKSSTPPTSNHISIKAKFLNDENILFSYTTIVNFHSYTNVIPQKREHEQDALNVINECIKLIKRKFKDETGKTINFKEEKREDSVEIIHSQPHVNYRKVAYFRVNARFNFQVK